VDEYPNVLRLQVAQHNRRPSLGAVLRDEGTITVEELERALAEVESRGVRLGEVLVEQGSINRRTLAVALAKQADLPFVDLDTAEIDRTAASLLPEQLARKHTALPIRFVGEDAVLVVVADPTDLVGSDQLLLALGLGVELAVAEGDSLEEAITRAYPKEAGDFERTGAFEEPLLEQIAGGAGTNAPAIKLVNAIIALAIDEGASDVHFEPQAREVIVRARIDGVMRQLTSAPKPMQAALTSRLKAMGELDIAETHVPQNSRASVRHEGRSIDIRVAVLPTTHGEHVAVRILHQRAEKLSLDELGMSAASREAFERAIQQPYGAVIVCGPTGSGKTTTLYAALERLNDRERAIMTIEDPVEFQVPGVNQVEVDVKAGITFARALRTILRSDPDVLMVGEVRDDETARIAVQAAMTGHLVLTTLHAHNAAASVERLVHMGVDPSLIASSVNCIVAQRLARRLCDECREGYHADQLERAQLGLDASHPDVELYRARGCVTCSNTGYRGRVALCEVMTIQGKLRRLVGAASEELFAAAVEQGMTTLREDGRRLVLEGVCSLDEIRRVTGDRLV